MNWSQPQESGFFLFRRIHKNKMTHCLTVKSTTRASCLSHHWCSNRWTGLRNKSFWKNNLSHIYGVDFFFVFHIKWSRTLLWFSLFPLWFHPHVNSCSLWICFADAFHTWPNIRKKVNRSLQTTLAQLKMYWFLSNYTNSQKKPQRDAVIIFFSDSKKRAVVVFQSQEP